MNLIKEFNRYGKDMKIIYPNGSVTPIFKGFIQPLRYKNKMYLYGVNTEIGYNSQGYYLYIGPPQYDLTKYPEATVVCDNQKYMIDRCEKMDFKGKPVYVWAIIRTVIEE